MSFVVIQMSNSDKLGFELFAEWAKRSFEFLVAGLKEAFEHLERKMMFIHLRAVQDLVIVKVIGAHEVDVLSRVVVNVAKADAVLELGEQGQRCRVNDLHNVHPMDDERFMLGAILVELISKILINAVLEEIIGILDVLVIVLIVLLLLLLLGFLGFRESEASVALKDANHFALVVGIWNVRDRVHSKSLHVEKSSMAEE